MFDVGSAAESAHIDAPYTGDPTTDLIIRVLAATAIVGGLGAAVALISRGVGGVSQRSSIGEL